MPLQRPTPPFWIRNGDIWTSNHLTTVTTEPVVSELTTTIALAIFRDVTDFALSRMFFANK